MTNSRLPAISTHLSMLATTAAAAAFFAGCAAPPPASSPHEAVARINGHNATGKGSLAPVIEGRVREVAAICTSQGGSMLIGLEKITFTTSGTTGPWDEELPTRYLCTKGGQAAWGMAVGYDKPNYVVAHGTLGLFGVLPGAWLTASYLDAQQAQNAERELNEWRARAQARQAECQVKQARAAKELHEQPRIGMEVVGGTVIELRVPLVLVQYDDATRTRVKRDQEWLPLASLEPKVNC